MPIQTWDKTTFDDSYQFNAEPDGHPNTRPAIKVGYIRSVVKPYCDIRASKLVEVFGWDDTTHLVIVGAGFGWTAEALRDNHNIINIIAIDTSTYVQDNFSLSDADEISEAIQAVGLDPTTGEGLQHFNRLVSGSRSNIEISNESLATEGSRKKIVRDLGQVDVVLTEMVMSTLTDAEALTLSENLNKIQGNPTIIHLDVSLSNPDNTDYNYKLLDDWKTLLPNDIWVNASSYGVL